MKDEQIRKDKLIEERYNPRPLILVAVALATVGFFFFISHRYFSLARPIDGSVWGEFGDFIGGVIGTIIAYISIRLLVATLNTQAYGNAITKDAADLSLAESKLQRLNANFQMLLGLYQKALANFNTASQEHETHEGLLYLKSKKDAIIGAFDNTEDNYGLRNKSAIKCFNDFYIENRQVASVYFRIIYRMLELIFEADIDTEDKAKYAKMLRCQLSEEELFFIRYNAMTYNGANMRKYLNQYNMMKHLPEVALLEFKKHAKAALTSADTSQMISSLIGLRKELIKRDKWAPNSSITPIHEGYTIECSMNAERNLYTLTLKRASVNLPVNNKESFDKLTLDELSYFIHDFIIELFTCYNFCTYQSFEDITVNATPGSENGQDTIVVTVAPVDSQKKLHLYIDRDPQTSEEYDI